MDAVQADRGRTLTEISNAIVGLHREHYGRGAVRARTIMQDNYVVCFLDDIYTPVEHTLLNAGRADSVRTTRLAFQDAMEPLFREAVTKATGRRVVAFMSQVHIEPDMAAEIFVLENGDEAASRDGSG
jgi:uncharacterized protein YbcI